jgi:hypothetical protein
MKVILTEEIRGLGTRGEVVTVKDGYARNFLLPKNLAREATKLPPSATPASVYQAPPLAPLRDITNAPLLVEERIFYEC